MLVEGLAMSQALGGFLERVEANEQIRNQIDEEQLPCGQVAALFDDDRRNEQNHRNGDFDDLTFQPTFMVVLVMMLVSMMMFMPAAFVFSPFIKGARGILMMFVCHILTFYFFRFRLQKCCNCFATGLQSGYSVFSTNRCTNAS